MPPGLVSTAMNRRVLAIIPPPEQANLGLVLRELIEEIHGAGVSAGIAVVDGERRFTHMAFVPCGVFDAMERKKLWQRGSPNGFHGCGHC